jgi:hypothetical protein
VLTPGPEDVVLAGIAASGLRRAIGGAANGVLRTVRRLFSKGDEVAQGVRAAPGAANRLRFEASPKHGRVSRGKASPGPTNGQEVLDKSIQVTGSSPRRVGVDPETGEFVVFSRTSEGVFHGHVRPWAELRPEMQNALVDAGMVTRRGKILGD